MMHSLLSYIKDFNRLYIKVIYNHFFMISKEERLSYGKEYHKVKKMYNISLRKLEMFPNGDFWDDDKRKVIYKYDIDRKWLQHMRKKKLKKIKSKL